MTKVICLFCVLASIISSISFCVAEASEVIPCADSEFASITTSLKSSKQVIFRALTSNMKKSISVTACWLEKKNADDSWSTVCTLSAPSTIASNAFSYSATMDYSSQIGTGTYRIRANYNADGHEVTRYSNERTFKTSNTIE